MLDLSFKRIAPNIYQKWNAAQGIRTTIHFDGDKIHVRHEQPVAAVLDLNVKLANDFSGYKGKELVLGSRIPITEHRKIMKQCGFQPGHGYDQKRFARILNDSDYRKFKTVPGKI